MPGFPAGLLRPLVSAALHDLRRDKSRLRRLYLASCLPYKSCMADQDKAWEPDWATCGTAGCIGIRLKDAEACLTHAEPQAREAFLAALKPGAALDLRGTPIDPELLSGLLAAVRPQHGPPTLGNAEFTKAQFSGRAVFSGAQFSRIAEFGGTQFSGDAEFFGAQFSRIAVFGGAQFGGNAEFAGAQFHGDAWFSNAQFSRDAGFARAQFAGRTWFSNAQFSRDAEFDKTRFSRDAVFRETRFGGRAGFAEAQFSRSAVFAEAQFGSPARFRKAQFTGRTWFSNARFNGDAEFGEAQFGREAWFSEAQFRRDARFDGARFSGDAEFGEAQFSGDAWFPGTEFAEARAFGPVVAFSTLILDRATFERDITIEVDGAELSCVGTRFAETATLRLRRTQVVLDAALFTKPSTLAFAPDVPKRHAQPRLLSLRGVDVATLTLHDLNLAACLFQGAHHLDQLRIEGARPFADTPGAWRLQLGRWRVPIWRRWSRRQTLAEEHRWRAELSRSRPARWSWIDRPIWHGSATQTPRWVIERTGQQVQPLGPDRLAVLYRALRKAQEDSKNQPGAADFYYGEMEMRRQDPNTSWPEWVILWLYWLFSGYGLRGLRALASLAVVVLGLAMLLHLVGYATHPSPASVWGSLLYAASSALWIGDDEVRLTGWGKLLGIALRLAGPVLLGLALLSIRNRVKR
jgi:Pentapeptide repeats (9 copies)